MAIPVRDSLDPLPATTLSQLLRNPRARAVWEARLPGTKDVLAAINQGTSAEELRIPPSSWTESRAKHSTISGAFDYAIGALWARESLSPVFRRVDSAARPGLSFKVLLPALAHLLLLELPGWLPDDELTPTQRDAFRGLGLLAELDAVYRSAAEPPAWTRELGSAPLTQLALEQHLRQHFPDAFVDELLALVHAGLADLPRGANVHYDPNFGSPPGLEHIRADGDLLVDGTLIEFKVSTQPFAEEHIWQLLGYVALDRLHGRDKVQNVALYNPRFRRYWEESAARLGAQLGPESFEDFCAWFRDTKEAHRF